jgi:hypothetical protein
VPPHEFATYLGLADCDGVAEWHDDLFLACHSVVNQLPRQAAQLALAAVIPARRATSVDPLVALRLE